jgi:hypothetical protein
MSGKEGSTGYSFFSLTSPKPFNASIDFGEDVGECTQPDLLLDASKDTERGSKVDEGIDSIPFDSNPGSPGIMLATFVGEV